MKNLLHPDLNFRLNGRLWVETDDDRFMGIGRLELLTQIQEQGSISKAAQQMGMSYKRAWNLVSSLNAQAAAPVVHTQTGGKRGGGAEVTPAGQQLIQEYRELQERFQAFMAAEAARLF
ncbi:winged helix-turn-helix domain-containing protein [Hymenobacter psychrotolerans]|uniref:Molybdate transport system regulatory protein n=1 Tax=Hymenobacter psychrotolerans DSM 18569 TaxID=1121959 RepID=A0A1M7FLI8_9BACT|nr:winged helix-turn-helix domain-containing protein [Hymenobacter psychrotolerans]SHM04931.1 molybdate transport system regulatory protein [Hymenobacter psychrotolerans DSM 18569]